MTRTGAQRICQLASMLYGDQIETTINESRVRERQGYSVVLLHKGLDRRLSLSDVDEWQGVKDAWATALGRATCESCGREFEGEQGYFEVDDATNGSIGYAYCAECCTW